MKKYLLSGLFIMFLFSWSVDADNDFCIEPRNSYSENAIADIQWSEDDSEFYISTMGQVWKYEIGDDHSPRPLHTICDGQFPVIGISEKYYAIGSDFLPVVLIYDLETDQLLFEMRIPSENVRAIAFNDTEDYLALSTSSWDEGGFFDIDRNIEVWDYRTGEQLAELVVDENSPDSVYLPFGSDVGFVADDTILVTGIDTENAWVLTQPMVYLWNWETSEVKELNIDPDTLLEVIDSDLVNISFEKNQRIDLQVLSLFPEFTVKSPQSYELPVDNDYRTLVATNHEYQLVAIENADGEIWVIDLNAGRIIYSRKLEKHARAIAFDHAGRYIALGYYDGNIQLWDLLSDTIATIGSVFES